MKSSEQQVMEARYSLPYNWMRPDFSRHFRQKNGILTIALEFAGDLSRKNVLDAGCGDGWYSYRIKEKFADANIEGTDYSGAAIDFARLIVKDVSFKDSSITGLDYEEKKFDTIFSFQVLEHIPPKELPKAVSELSRVLKDDGNLIVSVPSINRPMSKAHFQHFTVESINETLGSHFELERVVGQERHTFVFWLLERIVENRFWTLRPLATWFNIRPYMRYWNETTPEKGHNLILRYRKR